MAVPSRPGHLRREEAGLGLASGLVRREEANPNPHPGPNSSPDPNPSPEPKPTPNLQPQPLTLTLSRKPGFLLEASLPIFHVREDQTLENVDILRADQAPALLARSRVFQGGH